MKDFWEIGYWVDGRWKFEGRYDSPDIALAQITYKLGIPTFAQLESNGTYRVTNSAGTTRACVRLMTHAVDNTPGGQPQGRPGPLRRWHGLTWVGWLNYLVLRWFLFRVYYVVEEDGSISKYGVKFIPSWRW